MSLSLSLAGLALWDPADPPASSMAATHTHIRSTRRSHLGLHNRLPAPRQLEARHTHTHTHTKTHTHTYVHTHTHTHTHMQNKHTYIGQQGILYQHISV